MGKACNNAIVFLFIIQYVQIALKQYAPWLASPIQYLNYKYKITKLIIFWTE